ncbi:hypothetical protein B0H19DRAFT_1385456, partial [Mycena capillaripes]
EWPSRQPQDPGWTRKALIRHFGHNKRAPVCVCPPQRPDHVRHCIHHQCDAASCPDRDSCDDTTHTHIPKCTLQASAFPATPRPARPLLVLICRPLAVRCLLVRIAPQYIDFNRRETQRRPIPRAR